MFYELNRWIGVCVCACVSGSLNVTGTQQTDLAFFSESESKVRYIYALLTHASITCKFHTDVLKGSLTQHQMRHWMKTLMNINSAAIKNTLTVSGIYSKITCVFFAEILNDRSVIENFCEKYAPYSQLQSGSFCTRPVVSSVRQPLGKKDSYLVLFHQTASGQRLKIQFKALVLPQIITDRAGSSFHAVSLCLYSFSG